MDYRTIGGDDYDMDDVDSTLHSLLWKHLVPSPTPSAAAAAAAVTVTATTTTTSSSATLPGDAAFLQAQAKLDAMHNRSFEPSLAPLSPSYEELSAIAHDPLDGLDDHGLFASCWRLRQPKSGFLLAVEYRNNIVPNDEFSAHEKDTWALVTSLHQTKEEVHAGVEGVASSDKEVLDITFKRDLVLQRMDRVVRWAQECYQVNSLPPSQNRYWPHTSKSFGKDPKLVNSCDPDAPLRTGRTLASIDEQDEQLLLSHLFSLCRKGAFYLVRHDPDSEAFTNQAVKILVDASQPWRAASMLGGRPYSLSTTGESGRIERRGNAHRAAWKKACAMLANQSVSQ